MHACIWLLSVYKLEALRVLWHVNYAFIWLQNLLIIATQAIYVVVAMATHKGQFHRSLKEFNKKLIAVTSCLDAVVAGINVLCAMVN